MKDNIPDPVLTDTQRFIYMHGYFNCKTLVFKEANAVIEIMNDYDEGCLNKDSKKFILSNSNKKVLCNVNRESGIVTDIFVFGDDNIAFRSSCFQPFLQ